MTEFKPIIFSGETLRKFWDGPSNRFARYYTYLQKGFGIVNEAKNYILILFGTYWTIKTMSWWIDLGYSDNMLAVGLIIVALVGLGFLILIGRWDLFKLSKSREFAMVQHGSVTQFGIYNMTVKNLEIQEEQSKLLQEILKKIK